MHQPKLIKFLLFLILLLLAPIAYANKIDELKTDKDVFDLLVRLKAFGGSDPVKVMPTDTLLEKLDCNEVAVKWGVKAWERLDFNDDKLTDLIVIVKDIHRSLYIFAIVDNGNLGLRSIELSRGLGDDCQLVKPIMVDGKQMLAYYSKRFRMIDRKLVGLNKTEQVDTLIYLVDSFIEYNRKAADYVIKSVSMKVIDFIKVSGKGNVIYKPGLGRMFRDTLEMNLAIDSSRKTYVSKISLTKLNNIQKLLKYIDIKNKRSSYEVLWTDDAEASLTVEFADGTKKRIYDYGMIGSFGLTHLYETLLDLRKSLIWKPL